MEMLTVGKLGREGKTYGRLVGAIRSFAGSRGHSQVKFGNEAALQAYYGYR